MSQLESCRVLLFGGLGNQLFQIAAGLHAANGRPLVIDTSFIDKKNNKNWFYEHSKFAKINEVVIDNSSSLNWFSKRLIGLAIRSSTREVIFDKQKVKLLNSRRVLSKFLGNLVFSNSKVYIANGIGFDSEVPTNSKNATLIGYFQSYRWIELDKRTLTTIQKLIGYRSDRQRSSGEVLLQVRLGDFESTPGFQAIDFSYINNAIKQIRENLEITSIVVYSDDSVRAKNLLQDWRDIELIFDESDQLHPLTTLNEMTSFQNHVISSSTFGIWCAFLAPESQIVVAPTPWFPKSVEPRDLLPPTWFRVER
ncbi:Alpha-1,2-fucosyltransferase-like protein [Candidatus Planktophila lacus]|uniref:alpha-1,2-fucosyltransferase n=1 Tax=Candidatus Planktophila lacus TaxID=1884913 RepID=UPI000BACCBDC|nr:alpha-1,2-fucosyltransferase [Candidatus Planktophila lacus]ASY24521.1 Alpha-1,2-fucosyltransferase-like protein [Candidatus Planktophila lacus]